MPDELQSFIGRSQTVADEITGPALRRIASLLDIDSSFPPGTPIPPHWYAMFFPEIAPQSQLGADGHPRRGDFLPPVPLPRRMFAGRRVRFLGPLHVGDSAEKTSTITAVTPKTGRSGRMVFVTILHRIAVDGRIAVEEEQDVVYRDHPAPGAPTPAPTPVPDGATWSSTVLPDTRMLFRYSAITWNTHRIHYDADYTRAEEGYPALVVNGGLTLLLLLEAAIAAAARPLAGLSVRNIAPLFAGSPVTLAGDGQRAWAASASGALAVQAELSFRP
jgi:3-methylfumaryl-CoA hydratase